MNESNIGSVVEEATLGPNESFIMGNGMEFRRIGNTQNVRYFPLSGFRCEHSFAAQPGEGSYIRLGGVRLGNVRLSEYGLSLIYDDNSVKVKVETKGL